MKLIFTFLLVVENKKFHFYTKNRRRFIYSDYFFGGLIGLCGCGTPAWSFLSFDGGLGGVTGFVGEGIPLFLSLIAFPCYLSLVGGVTGFVGAGAPSCAYPFLPIVFLLKIGFYK